MLAEIRNVRQVPGEGLRRWFMDVADGEFSRDTAAERFRKASAAIDPGIRAFVLEAISRYPFSVDEPDYVI